MAVAGRSGSAPTASDAADRLRDAAFVRLLARPTGDALAATGLLARALDAIECPFQARIASHGTRDDLDGVADDETTVIVGARTPAADVEFSSAPTSASDAAFATARALDGAPSPDPVLALAGAFASNRGPLAEIAGDALDAAREAALTTRRPGVAIPRPHLVDGVAHSTLVHAPFSGDIEATVAAMDEMGDIGIETDAIADDALDGETAALDVEDGRTIASWLSLAVAGSEDATPRAATSVERALRPHSIANEESGFATVGGYADVLCAVAHEEPGTGLALVLGHDAREAALSAWREHARRAHAAVRSATFDHEWTDTPRSGDGAGSDGLAIARIEGPAPLATVSRLVWNFRVSTPAVVVLTDGRAAATGTDGSVPRDRIASAARALGGDTSGDDRSLTVRFEGSADAFLAALDDERTGATSGREDP